MIYHDIPFKLINKLEGIYSARLKTFGTLVAHIPMYSKHVKEFIYII
jgi:hypothetical protein